jgi:hypothetical protein
MGILPVDTSDRSDPVHVPPDEPPEPFLTNTYPPYRHCRRTGKERFHPWPPALTYRHVDQQPYTRMTQYRTGDNCCAKSTVSFQDVKGDGYMRCFHAALYGRHPHPPPPAPPPHPHPPSSPDQEL